MKPLSIKSKVTLVATALLAALLSLVLAIQMYYVKTDMKQVLGVTLVLALLFAPLMWLGMRGLANRIIKESEARLYAFMDKSPSIMFIKDREGRYLHVNERFARSFGLDRQEIISRTDSDIFPPDQAERFKANDAAVLAADKAIEIEETARYADGLHNNLVVKFPIHDASGHITAIGGIATDITERIRAGNALKESEDRLRTITDGAPALIGYIDSERRFRFNNKTYEDWYGLGRAEITGRTLREVLGEKPYKFAEPYVEKALAGEGQAFEAQIERGGSIRYVRIQYVPHFGAQHQVLGFYSLVNDVTELKLAEQALVRLARYDTLTGLPNRDTFNDRIGQAMARAKRNKTALALMYLDIDRFKSINDRDGHATGDQVLKEFAGRLTRCVRATDTVARMSGDEFVIILEGLDRPENARNVAAKIIAAMHPPFQFENRSIVVSSSVGIALWSGGGSDAEELIKQADAAMYMAKRSGRNNYQVYRPGDELMAAAPENLPT